MTLRAVTASPATTAPLPDNVVYFVFGNPLFKEPCRCCGNRQWKLALSLTSAGGYDVCDGCHTWDPQDWKKTLKRTL